MVQRGSVHPWDHTMITVLVFNEFCHRTCELKRDLVHHPCFQRWTNFVQC